MRLVILIAFQLHTSKVFSKKYASSSESIENLLYYQDCKHKDKTMTTTTPTPIKYKEKLRVPQQPDCPFPKMCCSLSCGNDCGGVSSVGRHMDSMQGLLPIQPISPLQGTMPQSQPQAMPRGKKKKMKALANILPTFGGRRDAGFTKDRIKSLISQDQDIRKILKDLVRVTMQKVDLLDLVNGRKNDITSNTDLSVYSEEDDMD